MRRRRYEVGLFGIDKDDPEPTGKVWEFDLSTGAPRFTVNGIAPNGDSMIFHLDHSSVILVCRAKNAGPGHHGDLQAAGIEMQRLAKMIPGVAGSGSVSTYGDIIWAAILNDPYGNDWCADFAQAYPEAVQPTPLEWGDVQPGAGDVPTVTAEGKAKLDAAGISELVDTTTQVQIPVWFWVVGAGVAVYFLWGRKRRDTGAQS